VIGTEFQLKTAPPRPGRTATARKRLEYRWAEVNDRTAIIVTAPQGFGKTTLPAQWRRNWLERGAFVAWASLDALTCLRSEIALLAAPTVVILGVLNAELCEAVTGDPEAAWHADRGQFQDAACQALAAGTFLGQPGLIASALRGLDRVPPEADALHLASLASSRANLALLGGASRRRGRHGLATTTRPVSAGLPMSNKMSSLPRRTHAPGNRALSIALAAALALPAAAGAAEFDTGNEDLAIRWDNTVRVNISQRVEDQDDAILANPNYDDGDRNFEQGSVFTRLDLLSEFDFVWKRALGFRVSAAAWWDPGYDNLDHTSVLTSNRLQNGRPVLGLSSYSDRYAQGPSGEFLDVFAFAKFNIGEAPVNVKLGQTTVYWGEGLLLGGAVHGVSYSQNPIDVWKGLATPGAEAKELFRPRVGFNVQAQVMDSLSIAAQYFFNWQSFDNQAYRYPESGTYLSVGDPNLWGADSFVANATGTQRAWRGEDIAPDDDTGNYGLAVRWNPQWADATIGAYYRRTYDMQPQAMLTPALSPGVPASLCAAPAGSPPGTAPFPISPPDAAGRVTCFFNPEAASLAEVQVYGKIGEYNVAFGKDVDIFGFSLSKQVLGVSVGAELSYRKDMPVLSEAVYVLPAQFLALVPGAITTGAAAAIDGDTPGARADTMHGLVNLLGVIGDTPLFDTASWATELTWMTWLDVTQNEGVFKGRKAEPGKWAAYTQIDAVDKNYCGLAVNFTPTWFQVFPGVDMLAPLSWSQGISGNSAVTAGGQEGAGSFGIGIAADIRQKYRFDLKYVGFYGEYSMCPRAGTSRPGTCADGAANVLNGTNAIISDRDFIALTFKTTF
jgi:hypothetical protein